MKKIHIAALCGVFVAGLLAGRAYTTYEYDWSGPTPGDPEELCRLAKEADNMSKDLAVNTPEIAEMMIREKPDTNFQTRYIIEGECRCPN